MQHRPQPVGEREDSQDKARAGRGSGHHPPAADHQWYHRVGDDIRPNDVRGEPARAPDTGGQICE